MAVTANKSTSQTNNDAIPRILNSSYFERGNAIISSGKANVLATDSDGSTYNICRLPSNVRVYSIAVTCPAITAGTSFKCGVFKATQEGGAAVDDACLFTGVDLSSAIAVPTNKLGTGKTYDPEKRLWEVAGLTSDPHTDLDIVLTGATVGSADGTVTVDVHFTF